MKDQEQTNLGVLPQVMSSLLPHNTRCLTRLVLTIKAEWAARPLWPTLGLHVCVTRPDNFLCLVLTSSRLCNRPLPTRLSFHFQPWKPSNNFQISGSWLWAVWTELWPPAIPQGKGFILAQDAKSWGVLGGHISQGLWAALTRGRRKKGKWLQPGRGGQQGTGAVYRGQLWR